MERLPLRKSTCFLFATALLGMACMAVLLVHPIWSAPRHRLRQERSRQLVARYGLTDLALFTEAPYTRHWSQADWHTPFKAFPSAFDHFPSGSHLQPQRIFPQRILPSRTAEESQ